MPEEKLYQLTIAHHQGNIPTYQRWWKEIIPKFWRADREREKVKRYPRREPILRVDDVEADAV